MDACAIRRNVGCNIFLDLPEGGKMPALGYGTWQSSDDSLEKGLEEALSAGYRHIDTAQAYQNEDIIGRVLKKWFDSGKLKREDIFITTKLSATSLYPDKVEECLKESLRKLQLDYVDLYLLHFPVTIVPSGAEFYGHKDIHYLHVWKKMEAQYDAGRTKAIGISNFNLKQVDTLLKNCRVKPANNQVELHVYLQQKELVDFCQKNGVTVVAYAPLASRGYNAFLEKMGLDTKEQPDLIANKVVVAIAKKYSKTPAQILLRFLLQVGVAPIPKSVTPARVKENFNVFDFVISDEDMKKLRGLDLGSKGRVCDWKAFVGTLDQHPEFPFE